MEPDEVVLSDVHLFTPHLSRDESAATFHEVGAHESRKACHSRFVFWNPSIERQEKITQEAEEDDDGDLVVQRQEINKKEMDVIVIQHRLETTLIDVGLQVWTGALLLSDFIVDQYKQFDGCVAMEMGAGVGLVSVVMGMFAKHVLCTDIGEAILENCQVNIEQNQSMYKYSNRESPVVAVKEFDWLKDEIETDAEKKFTWGENDLDLLHQVSVILAADVVYNNELTDGFFSRVHSLMSKPPAKTLYISVEKRLNFTLEDLDIACPAYDYFRACLDQLSEPSMEVASFTVQQIQADFPQYFQYQRVKHLELWKIQSVFKQLTVIAQAS